MHSAHINVWRLARNLLLTLVIPCSLGVAVDYMTGMWPVVTIIVCVIFFPISAIVVNRTALSELDHVIREAEREAESQSPGSGSPADTICEGF